MRLVHAVGEAVELRCGPDLLFRYVYESGVDPVSPPNLTSIHCAPWPGRR